MLKIFIEILLLRDSTGLELNQKTLLFVSHFTVKVTLCFVMMLLLP